MPRHQLRIKLFWRRENGSVLIETLLAVPIVTILTIGILEFGNVLWQRHQIQAGVRDAARYWSRCRPTFQACTTTIAQNLAFYGSPTNTGVVRVPNWNESSADADLTIIPAAPPTAPVASDVVTVTGTLLYRGSPLIGALNIGPIPIEYTYRQRYIGW